MQKCPTEHTNSILRITESQQQRGRRGEGFPRQFPSQHGYSSAMGLLLSCALILPSEKENCRIVCVYFVFLLPGLTCVCALSSPLPDHKYMCAVLCDRPTMHTVRFHLFHLVANGFTVLPISGGLRGKGVCVSAVVYVHIFIYFPLPYCVVVT